MTNAAGHVTTVNTSSVRLPAHYPPGHAVVMDVLKTMVTEDVVNITPDSVSSPTTDRSTEGLNTEGSSSGSSVSPPATQTTPEGSTRTSVLTAQFSKDVDVITQKEEVCVAWSGFYHAEEITVEIGLGTSPDHDDIVAFRPAESESPVCLNVTALPVYTKVFSVVKATSSGGTAVFSSDGFVMIPLSDPENKIMVFNGKGCHGNGASEGHFRDPSTSSVNISELSRLPVHVGDFLFVQFSPFVPHVTFDEAILLETTLTGYQVVSTSSHVTARLPASTSANSSVQVLHCQKDSPILPVPESHVTVTWEMTGLWTQFIRYLKVEVMDKTCLDTSVKKDKYLRQQCLLHQEKVQMMTSELKIYNDKITNYVLQDHSYVASISSCVDDDCLPAVFSDVVIYTNAYSTNVHFDHAVLTDVSTQLLTVDVLASSAAETVPSMYHRNLSCLYQWAVGTDTSGSFVITDWAVQTTPNCSKIEVNII